MISHKGRKERVPNRLWSSRLFGIKGPVIENVSVHLVLPYLKNPYANISGYFSPIAQDQNTHSVSPLAPPSELCTLKTNILENLTGTSSTGVLSATIHQKPSLWCSVSQSHRLYPRYKPIRYQQGHRWFNIQCRQAG